MCLKTTMCSNSCYNNNNILGHIYCTYLRLFQNYCSFLSNTI